MLILFWVCNIFPVVSELKPGWLGAVLSTQELSCVSFFCPLSDLFLSQISFLHFRTYHDISLGHNQQILVMQRGKKITKERKEKRASVEKNIFEHMQNEMF